MALRRKVALVARHEFQSVLVGNRCLESVGQLPPVTPAQSRGEIGNLLINDQRREAIEELNCLARGALARTR